MVSCASFVAERRQRAVSAFTLAILACAYECQLMPHLAVHGTQLYYECHGSGPPLLTGFQR